MATDKSTLKTKIMLVEPSATMRYVLQNYCEKSDYETESFSSFDKALDACSDIDEFEGQLVRWPRTTAERATTILEIRGVPTSAEDHCRQTLL